MPRKKSRPPQTSWSFDHREAIANSLLIPQELRGETPLPWHSSWQAAVAAPWEQSLHPPSHASLTTCLQSSGAEATVAAPIPLAEICLRLSAQEDATDLGCCPFH